MPERDPKALFAKLVLDGMQAGLSWWIILQKRDSLLAAYANFDPERVALFDAAKVEALLADPGVIRSRQKIGAAIANARAYLDFTATGGDFSDLLWDCVGGSTQVNAWRTLADYPASTPASVAMSKRLRSLGFKFVGPTICYAFMQAVGMVNDHTVDCYRYRQCA